MTNWQAYSEAVRFLMEASGAMDQAHACMKDLKVDQTDDSRYTENRNALNIQIDIQRLLIQLRHEECEDCGHLLSRHGDKYGCEYERGDGYRAGSDVLEAMGPCGCDWGQREVGSKEGK